MQRQCQTSLRTRSQGGAALLIFALVLISVLLGGLLIQLNSATQANQRDQAASESLAHAKEALIGFAITYRDTHVPHDQVFGYLACPDTDNDGVAEASCGTTDVSVIGRLPWKTIGIPPPRDATGECLWYAVSGHFKDSSPKTASLNWDTLGQFTIQDPTGTTLAGASAHERPFAVIFAPRSPLPGQSRATAGASECRGSNNPTDYLEGIGALGTGDTSITLANPDSIRGGTNNDQGLWISSNDIFERINRRSDFTSDIDSLLNDIADDLNRLPPASLPNASPGNKGADALSGYVPASPQKISLFKNWRDNLLYAGGPTGSFTVNGGTTTCRALLLFSGSRTTRTVAPLIAQTRSTIAEKGDPATFGDAAMYLEGSNAILFPANGAYAGATLFNTASPGADLVRCINGLGSGGASFSNPTDFASFTPAGVAVTPDVTTNPAAPSVSIADASGSSGGCFWFPSAIPLAGKSLRAYYNFKLFYPDTFALGDPVSDRGNGFTLQMLRSDLGPPTACGSETNMGILDAPNPWGSLSFIFETDIRRDISRSDPAGNHTAIMINGNLRHSPGTMNTDCNGTVSGCRRSPANGFEESPAPLTHNQRIEIHTGCNAGCMLCNPAAHAAPNTFARISVWVDCADCSDVVADLNRLTKPPTIQRCSALFPEMNAIYFGLTGGFRSGATLGAAPAQSVTISNLSLRSD